MTDNDLEDKCVQMVEAFRQGALSPDDVSKKVSVLVEKATEHLSASKDT
jgi:hypothetical protein